MAKIKYIGHKETRADTVTGSGVVWFGHGDVQEVPDASLDALLRHADVWELAAPTTETPPDSTRRRPHTPLYDNSKVVLLHTALLPDTFTIKDRAVTQAEAIQHAFHEDADLTEEQWNALTDEDRAERIKVALEHIETGEGHPDAPVALVAEGLAALDDEALRAICKERKFKVHHTKKGDALRTAILEAQSAEAAQAAKG